MLEIGDTAPNFSLPSDQGGLFSLRDTDTAVVIFFYPKDDTPGCTAEAIDFTLHLREFEELSVTVVGVSPDPINKHRKFRDKHDLKVPLVSDETKEMLESYGVWVEKNMYGRKFMGVERSTFLINTNGKIIAIWRKVKVKGHVEKVLEAVRTQLSDS